ncbi:lactose ABC transporter membrane protein [Rhizobium sp. PP-F2F-G38]|uniref:Carbohydrate ABC transporter permease n=1 Tax=Ferranicluibacter rubi TaxID=2715133 RepID=A0AA44CA49_9HYPH|nr:carbohydrate ABC transporter permease [Ferranicluibacter rubi]PYE33970.1 lactose ABC transporter membrane protein [Rhizobium sp. PP-WC-1G-195]PYE94493.1 lactose ABC transporter membrane protein [Rhizobium sp. PP-F2F-G38]TCP80344.1 lactose ABC transporter membrane protein [Rhizobium sp. PP-CC-2G-626]TCQ23706.1 lactose ABC transporter membrane protein [Rhizobium sp. PP-CC-3G-465]NHT75483.1 carbohydrate ABC transporter permease [Ferranicluibacter rubi]
MTAVSASRASRALPRAATYVALSVAAFVSVFPFIWMMISSTNTSIDIIKGKATFGSAFSTNVANFFAQVDVPLVFWNSAKVAILATLLTIAVSSLAGYGFEMFRSKMRDRIYSLVLLTLMVPFAALMIPLFMMMGKAGLINTHIAILLPTVASAFIIFYFRQATKAFPTELRDAAKVDGLKEWHIFLYIYVPVMRSTYAAAFVIVFMMNWNNYLWPLIVLQSNDTKTITLVVSSLASAYYPDFGVVMIGTILATLPTLLVFFVMQRQFVAGMLGSVK